MPTPTLIPRAARFFVLAEQASRLGFDHLFWDLSAPPLVETVAPLPAMAAAVKTVGPLWQDILWSVARYPLPGVLPPEAVPWHNRLVAAWEVHRASSYLPRQNLARRALVRLDGCGMPEGQARPSRLPEWLAEAPRIASGEWRVASGEWRVVYQKMEALAALAAWRPAPRVLTPPETLREWVTFWMKLSRSRNPVEKGIAAIALLNLPEVALRAASISPVPAVKLLHHVTKAIRVAAESTDPDYLSLLDWQPVKRTTWPTAKVRNVAQTWLESSRHKDWLYRCAAWRQLIRWDGAGSLDICGMGLLSELVKAIQTEEESGVLREMSRWAPTAQCFISTGTPNRRSQLQQLERTWETHRTSGDSWIKAPAWLAGIRLHQAGLASEPPESFLQAWLFSVANEGNSRVLFILAQWSPGAEMPEIWHRTWKAAWQQRLLDKKESIRQTATWALLRQSLEKEHGSSWRCVGLELWRAGTKASSEVKDTLNAVPSRLQDVQAHLAAGEVPDFEKEPALPAERHRPPLALPPGRIAGREWKMENEELNMKNGEWRMQHQEAIPKPPHHLVPDSLSR